MSQMNDHVFDCSETYKQQNDILQEILNSNDQHLYTCFDIVDVEDVLYLLYTCGYLKHNFLFPVTSEKKCYIWDLIFYTLITQEVLYIFILITI